MAWLVSSCHKAVILIRSLSQKWRDSQFRVRTSMGDLTEDPANKKVVSTLHRPKAHCEADRKQFRDKHSHVKLWELKTGELSQMCTDGFLNIRNRTLERHQFFAPMQQPGETLYQFWHALNGCATLEKLLRLLLWVCSSFTRATKQWRKIVQRTEAIWETGLGAVFYNIIKKMKSGNQLVLRLDFQQTLKQNILSKI